MAIHTEVCECCWATVSAYVHVLNKWLVGACRKIVDVYEATRQPVLLKNHLTHNQLANSSKLYNHWLIQKSDIEWAWFPTEKCIDFIYGRIGILDRVMTFNKKVLAMNHEYRERCDKKQKVVSVSDIDETQYKRWRNFAEEKWTQYSLFSE